MQSCQTSRITNELRNASPDLEQCVFACTVHFALSREHERLSFMYRSDG